jgi:hypothetical protein
VAKLAFFASSSIPLTVLVVILCDLATQGQALSGTALIFVYAGGCGYLHQAEGVRGLAAARGAVPRDRRRRSGHVPMRRHWAHIGPIGIDLYARPPVTGQAPGLFSSS